MPDCFVDFLLPPPLKKYTIVELLGHGEYGYVYRGETRQNAGETIKVMVKFGSAKDMKQDYCILNREIRILSLTNNENIVRLIDCWIFNEDANCRIHYPSILVMESCISDLEKCKRTVNFSLAEIRNIGLQILRGLEYLDRCEILHCNMKPSNVLLSSTGILKICEFTYARPYGFYNEVPAFNLIYSPPELLLGVRHLGYAVDAWSTGCILAELCNGGPLFSNVTKLNQLASIFTFCGTFGEETMDILRPYLPDEYKKAKILYDPYLLEANLMEIIADSSIRSLLCRLLTTDPRYRWTSRQAMESSFNQSLFGTDLMTLVRKVENPSLIWVENPVKPETIF